MISNTTDARDSFGLAAWNEVAPASKRGIQLFMRYACFCTYTCLIGRMVEAIGEDGKVACGNSTSEIIGFVKATLKPHDHGHTGAKSESGEPITACKGRKRH